MAEKKSLTTALVVLSSFVSVSCGGGGGGSSSPPPIPYMTGVYQASSTFAAQCAAPRSGIDPATGLRYPDVAGSTLAENNWLRSWTNELYLWYREVPDLNPGGTSTTAAYFDLLKTSAMTASGAPKDKFHFTYPTSVWEALSQSNVQAGYGADWIIFDQALPINVFVAYTEPNSPATTAPANLVRGAQVLAVDTINIGTIADLATFNALIDRLFPSAAGQTHNFSILDPGATVARTITMTSANITSSSLPDAHVIPNTTVGYVLLNDHLATAETALITAINLLKSQNITDLVLDIRYNGGGYIDIASELAYMIAGTAPTAGKTFELTVFNDKHPTIDPVTGQPITPLGFHTQALGITTTPAGTQLPHLDLQRVFVLTGPDTCSASESVINSLRGVGVTVYQFGSTTCGKPYGFYPQDNCGTTYFSIEFQGVNQLGFGDYPDGFSPSNTVVPAGVSVPGCSVRDDLGHALGDPNEARLAAALGYRQNQSCPVPSGLSIQRLAASGAPIGVDGRMRKSPLHQNRIYRR